MPKCPSIKHDIRTPPVVVRLKAEPFKPFLLKGILIAPINIPIIAPKAKTQKPFLSKINNLLSSLLLLFSLLLFSSKSFWLLFSFTFSSSCSLFSFSPIIIILTSFSFSSFSLLSFLISPLTSLLFFSFSFSFPNFSTFLFNSISLYFFILLISISFSSSISFSLSLSLSFSFSDLILFSFLTILTILLSDSIPLSSSLLKSLFISLFSKIIFWFFTPFIFLSINCFLLILVTSVFSVLSVPIRLFILYPLTIINSLSKSKSTPKILGIIWTNKTTPRTPKI